MAPRPHASLPYALLVCALVLCGLYCVSPFFHFAEPEALPAFSGSPGYFLPSPLGGEMRVVPFSGPALKNPAVNPPLGELAPAAGKI